MSGRKASPSSAAVTEQLACLADAGLDDSGAPPGRLTSLWEVSTSLGGYIDRRTRSSPRAIAAGDAGADSTPPVQLRLVISRATAPTPDFAYDPRVRHSALEYYERPNRCRSDQVLFERAPGCASAASQPTPRRRSIRLRRCQRRAERRVNGQAAAPQRSIRASFQSRGRSLHPWRRGGAGPIHPGCRRRRSRSNAAR